MKIFIWGTKNLFYYKHLLQIDFKYKLNIIMECENSLDDFAVSVPRVSHPQSSKDNKSKVKSEDEKVSDSKKASDDKKILPQNIKLLPLDKINGIQLMLNEKLYENAVELLESMSGSLPSSTIMNEVLYAILMEPKDPQMSVKSHMYLKIMIRCFPPTSELRHFYYEVLFSERQKSSAYDFMCTFFDCLAFGKCSNKNNNENCDEKCHKNCYCVFDVIMSVLEANHLWTMSQKNKKYNSLICDIFWPHKNIQSVSDNVQDLLCRVNTFYALNNFKEKVIAHDFLIRLFKMMIETAAYMSKLNKVEVITHSRCFGAPTIIDKINNEILFTCTNIKGNAEKLNYFLTCVKPTWFETVLAESILNELLGPSESSRQNLHLRNIIFKYMFKLPDDAENENRQRSKKLKLLKTNEKNLSKTKDKTTGPFLKKKPSDVVHQVSELHKACIGNNMFDFDMLMSQVDPYDANFNLKDLKGKTPLHYACEYGHSLCVSLFISALEKKMKDDPERCMREVFAADKNGRTPLHVAVEYDYLNIVDILFNHGGLFLLSVKDNDEKIPMDLAQTSEMYITLDNARTRANLNPALLLVEESSPIFCNNPADRNIYFVCLYHTFSSFSDYFCLESFLNTKPDENTLRTHIEDHFSAKFINIVQDDVVEGDAITQFCDDVYILSKLNAILEHYFNHFVNRFHDNNTHLMCVTDFKEFTKELFHE